MMIFSGASQGFHIDYLPDLCEKQKHHFALPVFSQLGHPVTKGDPSMSTPAPGPFGYYVNLDERGDFYADVRDPAGATLFEIRAEDDGSISMIEDGFMRHKSDLDGLRAYLIDMGLIDKGAVLLPSDRFESRLDEILEP
jgi:hypothetical protein